MRLNLSQAISYLRSGQVIAVPTETVYGLAACLDQPEAIEQIFVLKGRPKINPLIIHVSHWSDIEKYVQEFPPHFEALAQSFWPGPLTCVLPLPHQSNVPSIVRADLPTAGFRVPDLEITRQLIQETGPLVMPSANLSGKPSSTRPEHIEEDFGIDFPILEGGICSKGVESTILFFIENEWVIFRLGALAPQAFIPVLGYAPRFLEKKEGERPLSPGQLLKHYAPRAQLILGNDSKTVESSFILGFKERKYAEGKCVIFLGSLSNPEEVAENLYQCLRYLDQIGADRVWVDMDFPREGLWQTIAERLMRAGQNHEK